MSLHGRLSIHMSTKLEQAVVSAGMCLVVSFFLLSSFAMVTQHFVLCISKMLPQIESNGLLPSFEPQASSYKTGAIL